MANKKLKFDEYYAPSAPVTRIASEDGFYLNCKEIIEEDGKSFEFWIEDDMGIVYDLWTQDKKDIDTAVGRFEDFLDDYYDDPDYFLDSEEGDLDSLDYTKDDDEPSDWLSKYSSKVFHYEPPKKRTGFFDEYTKSNTLVFHKTDNSTDMLAQMYAGRDWDVIRGTYDLDQEELFRVVDAHERIICLGHGSPGGLIGMFGPEMAPHFRDKKLFVIWCNADAYFNKYGIGEGQFITGNMPSEVWECRAAGCGKISTQLMLDNITYWSKLCADVTEQCLEGNVRAGVEYIRKHYLEKYGNHPVTIYNSNRTQVLGEEEPLPSYQFKGEPLGEEDQPVGGFDEKAFLKHPVEKATECPRVPGYVEPEPKVSTTYNNTYFRRSPEKTYLTSPVAGRAFAPSKAGQPICDYWETLIKDLNLEDFIWRKYVSTKQELVKKALEKFPNKEEITKLSDEEYKQDMEDLYYDWSIHVDRSKFKKGDSNGSNN